MGIRTSPLWGVYRFDSLFLAFPLVTVPIIAACRIQREKTWGFIGTCERAKLAALQIGAGGVQSQHMFAHGSMYVCAKRFYCRYGTGLGIPPHPRLLGPHIARYINAFIVVGCTSRKSGPKAKENWGIHSRFRKRVKACFVRGNRLHTKALIFV